MPSVLGPLSNSLSGIRLFMQAVIAGKPWLRDPLAVRQKWDDEAYALAEHGGGKNMTFAILWNDGVVEPTPPVIRALEMTKQALLKIGHKGAQPINFILRVFEFVQLVIDWKPYKHAELYKISVSCLKHPYYVCAPHAVIFQGVIWNAASKKDFDETTAASGEPIIATMDLEPRNSTEANPTFRPSSDLEISAYQLWQAHKQKRILRKEYLDHWQSTIAVTGTGRPVDAIISPVLPYPATPHGKSRRVSSQVPV